MPQAARALHNNLQRGSHMKHSTGFALCLAVIVLTGMVTASAGLLLIKQQDVTALQRRINELREENLALRARLKSYSQAEHAHPGERGNSCPP
jgi:Tfp pilus assembly protein PilN